MDGSVLAAWAGGADSVVIIIRPTAVDADVIKDARDTLSLLVGSTLSSPEAARLFSGTVVVRKFVVVATDILLLLRVVDAENHGASLEEEDAVHWLLVSDETGNTDRATSNTARTARGDFIVMAKSLTYLK